MEGGDVAGWAFDVVDFGAIGQGLFANKEFAFIGVNCLEVDGCGGADGDEREGTRNIAGLG